ncbi:MAG: nodulation protein NfeD [Euryarchaeota archaeon]|nr:nodulation protein NfeD [Euryarchaeota archaeon]
MRAGSLLIILLIALLLNINCAHTLEGGTPWVCHLKVEGVIDPVVKDYVKRGLREAEAGGAEAVVIQLDTPGGLDSSMRSVVKDILDSGVPVVTYVHPRGARAASAGSFILVAGHVAAMTPQTNVGAAHPVNMGTGEAVSEKITNDAAAYMESLAEGRGRNATLARSFVTNSTSITESRALEAGIIDIIAPDLDSLLVELDGMTVETSAGERTLRTRGAEVVELPMDAREEFFHTISNPNVAYILFLAGLYGIIFELSSPGAVLPGVVGGICILLALWSFQALSISAAGLALIIFAVVLLLLETQTPSHGVLALGGVTALFLGSLMLMDAEKEPFVRISLDIIVLATGVTAAFVLLAVGLVVKARRRRPATGREGMVGETGRALTDLDPEGTVFVHGERWQARAREGYIQKDKKVKVVDVEKLTLVVEEVN